MTNRLWMGGVVALVSLALAASSCRDEPPTYLHQIFVDAVQADEPGTVRLILRFVGANGEVAPPAQPEALTPVVQGRPIGRFAEVAPIKGRGIVLCLVVDPALPGALFEPLRAGYLQVVEALGEGDRVAVLRGVRGGKLTLLSPQAAKQQLLGLRPAALEPAAGTGADRRRAARAGGWLNPPLELLERGIRSVAAQGAAAPRRALLVLGEGRKLDRTWSEVARWAAADGVELHVVAVPPSGRSALAGRFVRPLVVYPAEDPTVLPQAFTLAAEGVAGGYLATASSDVGGVALLDGLGVRARLPRRGWEEFGVPALTTRPGQLTLKRLRTVEPGVHQVVFEASDARQEPLRPALGDVGLVADERPLRLLSARAGPAQPVVLALVRTPPGSEEEATAQREAMLVALARLEPQDRALVTTAGGAPPGEPRLSASREALRAQVAGLSVSAAPPERSLEEDLVALAKWLERAAPDSQRAMLLLSNAEALRRARGRGRGSYRFQAMLRVLRQTDLVPLWVVRAPRGRLRSMRAQLRRVAGGDLQAGARWPELPRLASDALVARLRPLVVTFRSDLPERVLRRKLRGRFVLRGRLIESGPGVAPTPALRAGRAEPRVAPTP